MGIQYAMLVVSLALLPACVSSLAIADVAGAISSLKKLRFLAFPILSI
jgi:hypothetical protein